MPTASSPGLDVTSTTGRTITVSVDLDAILTLPQRARREALDAAGRELQNIGWMLRQATGPQGRLRAGVLGELFALASAARARALRELAATLGEGLEGEIESAVLDAARQRIAVLAQQAEAEALRR